jgi:hypothetical protein
MLRRVFAVALKAGLVLALVSCASPTLPLPPPEIPTVGMGSDANHVTLTASCGSVEGYAEVLIENDAVPSGVLPIAGTYATPCGSWSADVYAHKGDSLKITQVVGGESSQETTMQVP